MKSLESMSDKCFEAICWGFLLFRILRTKYVAFSLTVLGILKWDCEIKMWKISSVLPLKNNSVTIGLDVLLDSISAITSWNTINTPLFFVEL